MSKLIVISIKPEFAQKIFDGSKTIELRKSSPKVNSGDLLIVYSTYPEMAILGVCRIKEVIIYSPEQMWELHSQALGIDQRRFFEYYSGARSAVGIVLENTRRFKVKITLDNLKQQLPNFSPPQTFKYYERKVISNLF